MLEHYIAHLVAESRGDGSSSRRSADRGRHGRLRRVAIVQVEADEVAVLDGRAGLRDRSSTERARSKVSSSAGPTLSSRLSRVGRDSDYARPAKAFVRGRSGIVAAVRYDKS
ncbi:MAG: hypothetical protein MZU91_11735 [Desulfosudis oleivorans]|nr:hypothetical protein [Desulfosudis oleivorans]